MHLPAVAGVERDLAESALVDAIQEQVRAIERIGGVPDSQTANSVAVEMERRNIARAVGAEAVVIAATNRIVCTQQHIAADRTLQRVCQRLAQIVRGVDDNDVVRFIRRIRIRDFLQIDIADARVDADGKGVVDIVSRILPGMFPKPPFPGWSNHRVTDAARIAVVEPII